jgi:hypothetical protein
VADLRAHKKLMDDYKSGSIERVKAIPQGSWWRRALPPHPQGGRGSS